MPALLRPLGALLVPYIRRIRSHRQNARRLLIPEIERRRSPGSGPKDDMLSWLSEASEGEDSLPEQVADQELGLGFAATHGMTNLIVNTLYDLVARWDDYAHQLRNEIEQAWTEDGGKLHASSISRLSKLDSFIKESQRLCPGSACKMSSPLAWNQYADRLLPQYHSIERY